MDPRRGNVGPPWSIEVGDGPVVAAAIHNGHEVRADVATWFVIPEEVRFREEDPLTGIWTQVGDSRILVHRSRFEVDLNRPRDRAVALHPEQTWGQRVFRQGLPEHLVQQARVRWDAFYGDVRRLLDRLLARHPRLLVLDLHSYNYRRGGPHAPPDDPATAPEINVGTATLSDPDRFAPVLARFEQALGEFDFHGRHLDVRENVRFQGGYFPRWLHETYPGRVCAIAVELKKFFMDEWDAKADIPELEAVRSALLYATNEAREPLAAIR
jgi:N-formylglutamate amidohydrolase